MDKVYRQLEVSAAAAQRLAQEGHDRGRLGHEGGLVERDAMVFQAARRIAQLDAAHEGLVFGRLDMRAELDPQPRYVGRIGLRDERPRLAADRLARAGGRGVLPGDRGRAAATSYAAGCCAAPARGSSASRTSCSTPALEGRHRPADRRRGRADGPAVPGPRPVDALDRRDHPGRAGQGDPRARPGRRRDQRRPGHRQDRRGAAPRGVPALHRPAPLRERRRADRRSERRLHALHRAGAAVASARPRSRCARSARSSTASGPPATTSRPSPTSRARPGWRPCCAGPRGCRRRAAPTSFRVFWRDDVIALDRGALGRVRRQLMSQGRRNRQLPRVAGALLDADVAPGARRARSRAWPRGVRRRHARRPGRSSTSCWPGGRRSTPPTCSAGCATPSCWPGSPRACSAPRSSGCCSSRGAAATPDRAVGPGRAAARRAALRARRRAGPHRRRARPRRDRAARGRPRHAGAADRLRPRVRAVRPRLGAADAPDRGRPVRPRADRRGAGPHADAVADGRPPRPHRLVDDRRRPGAVVVADPRASRRRPGPRRSRARTLHEFHLSTNYRNSAEIYEYAAAYAERVGLDADLPDRRPLDRRRAAGGHRASPTSRPRPARRCSRWPARSRGTVGVVVPVARRSEVNAWLASWPELADDAPERPRRRSTPRSRRPARTGSSC